MTDYPSYVVFAFKFKMEKEGLISRTFVIKYYDFFSKPNVGTRLFYQV